MTRGHGPRTWRKRLQGIPRRWLFLGVPAALVRKVYERVVGGVAKVLENRLDEQVATRVEISGRIDNPQVSVVDVIVRLVQNAFFKAILPGLYQETRRVSTTKKAP